MVQRRQTVQGLTAWTIRWRRGRPEWLVRVDKVRAARFGLTVEDISAVCGAGMWAVTRWAVRWMTGGADVGTIGDESSAIVAVSGGVVGSTWLCESVAVT
jgi:hypothetical protein